MKFYLQQKKDLHWLYLLSLEDKKIVQNMILHLKVQLLGLLLTNSTKPLTEKILFSPLIGFIFFKFPINSL